MSILIKGMDMPTEGTVIAIYKLNGKFYASVHGTELCPLVSVPPHGRLIDADELIADVRKHSESYFADDFAHEWVDKAPTIIEAEEE